MLEKLGCSVTAVENGEEAIAAAKKTNFALILMDIQMPVVDGFEATQGIRADETELGKDRVHIVALTANASAQDKEACLAADMDEFITKPISLKVIRKIVTKRVSAVTESKAEATKKETG